MFDFDRVIERRGTHATKWDNMARLSGIEAPDAIPMWVADMDFAAPPGVTEALAAESRRAVYGYYADTGSWAAALTAWMARRHGLQHGPGLGEPDARHRFRRWASSSRRRPRPGDEVVVFPPAYHAFRRIIAANERRILDAQLVERDGRYCHGPGGATRQADAAHQGRLLLQPAQSGRHRLVGRGDPRAGHVLRAARPDPGVR